MEERAHVGEVDLRRPFLLLGRPSRCRTERPVGHTCSVSGDVEYLVAVIFEADVNLREESLKDVHLVGRQLVLRLFFLD